MYRCVYVSLVLSVLNTNTTYFFGNIYTIMSIFFLFRKGMENFVIH